MRRFVAALRFLTILPLPTQYGSSESDLRGSVVCFPLIGLLIGGVGAGLAWILWQVFPALPAGMLIVIFLLAVSGGFHLDGLSDTADGFLSSRPRDRILEIMKDSRVGAMGVIAVVCVLGLKTAALGSLNASTAWRAVVLMPLAGRCLMVVNMTLLPYARREGGLGNLFYEKRSWVNVIWALAVLGLAGWLVAGVAGLVAVGISTGTGLIFAVYSYRKIGGATGDTLGASCEIVETISALIFAAGPVQTLLGLR
ncbi:MAG: adenosylcobinamide-GDP ribazoletransferase [Phycisphaerae bacterium]